MKITIYTVKTCQFSAEEKEYLKSKNIPFEEKDVEEDHAALEEMLKVSNNFAGTPVTNIVKDDTSSVVLKGFTKEEFEKELTPKAPEPVAATAPDAKPGDTPVPTAPNTPPAPPTDVLNAPPAPAASASPAPNPLDSILQDLQSKMPPPTLDSSGPPTAPPTPTAPAGVSAAPTVPDFPKNG